MQRNEPIVISHDTWRAIEFETDFNKWAKEQGIRNPFAVHQALFNKRVKETIRNFNGKEIPCTVIEDQTEEDKLLEPTKEEKENWRRMRDEYVARRCFYEIGWDSFEWHVRNATVDLSWMLESAEFVPCESIDSQCMIYCPFFGDCGG